MDNILNNYISIELFQWVGLIVGYGLWMQCNSLSSALDTEIKKTVLTDRANPDFQNKINNKTKHIYTGRLYSLLFLLAGSICYAVRLLS